MLVPIQVDTTWRLHTGLYKFGKNISSDISYTEYFWDLNLGEGLCIFTFFHFPDSGLYLLNGFDFLFWSILNGMTLKTSNSSVNAHRRWAIVLLSSQPRSASEKVKWWALLLRLKNGRDRTWHDKEDRPTLTSRSLQSIARPFQKRFR